MPLVEKLGSSKDSIREASRQLIAALLQQTQPRAMLSAITAAPASAKGRVRNEAIAIINEASC